MHAYENFDTVLGGVVSAGRQGFHLAVFYDRLGGVRREGERGVLPAEAAQFFRGSLLKAKLRLHSRRAGNANGMTLARQAKAIPAAGPMSQAACPKSDQTCPIFG